MDPALRAEIVGVLLCLAGLAGFLAVLEGVESFREPADLAAFDVDSSRWLRERLPESVVRAGLLLGDAGSALVVTTLVGLAALVSWRRGRRFEAGALVGSALALQLAVWLLKLLFQRPRPETAEGLAAGFSFPSGHAAFGAFLALVLVWFALRDVRIRALSWTLVGLASLWALLQAAGRVAIGVHYPSDVLAGLSLGFATGGAGLALVPFARRMYTLRRVRAGRKVVPKRL